MDKKKNKKSSPSKISHKRHESAKKSLHKSSDSDQSSDSDDDQYKKEPKLKNTNEEIDFKKKYKKLKETTTKWHDFSIKLQEENSILKERLEKVEEKLRLSESTFSSRLKEVSEKHKDELMDLKFQYREDLSDLKSTIRLKEGEIQNMQRSSQDIIKYWENLYKEESRKKS
jgi:hypothetical protein